MHTKVHSSLYNWYQKNGRHHLPWRLTNDAYRIWISEIMLQQTQVKTVLERFYFPFLEAFPTLADLAAADLDEVLKKWEGLGYYTRARHLHKTAQLCGNDLPLHVTELAALPGIGKSTAHAIAAFAYETPVPILDANVKRILCRYFALDAPREKELWEAAYTLFDEAHPFEYNQALMDLGSSLCGAKSVTCKVCPLKFTCKAASSDPFAYPKPKTKRSVPIKRRHIVVYEDQGRYAMAQRKSRFLHGLWGFLEYALDEAPSGARLGSIVQKYSHFHLHAEVSLVEQKDHAMEYFTLEEINDLALSGADKKVLALLT